MSQIPLISIAMGTYNGEKYLKEQLDSIYAQTYTNIEVIVTDDCSSDTTVEILEQYAKSHGLRYFVNEHNLGFVKNFEKAISLCLGQYIALADQDDVWEKEKIEFLVRHLGGSSLIHSDASLINDAGVVFSSSYTRYSKKVLHKDIFSYLMGNNVTGCTALFSRELLDFALPFPEGIFAHDWWLAVCAFKNGRIVYCDYPLIRYRQHASNQIGAANSKHIHPLEAREKAFKKTAMSLQALLNASFFSTHEKQFIVQLIQYYNDFFTKMIRFHSFVFHFRYFRYFNEGKPFLYQLVGLFLSLFGEKIQKQLWRLIGK
jgi:glycosyltransferase involved in cell wall biosynthesis